VPTFLHQKWAEFFDERLPGGATEALGPTFWKAVLELPDRAFWAWART
jgi:hypothetical protein